MKMKISSALIAGFFLILLAPDLAIPDSKKPDRKGALTNERTDRNTKETLRIVRDGAHITWTGHRRDRIYKLFFSRDPSPFFRKDLIQYQRGPGEEDAWFSRSDLMKINPNGNWQSGKIFIRLCEYNPSIHGCYRYSNTLVID